MTAPILFGILLFAVQMLVLYLVVRAAVRGALRDNQETLKESLRVVLYEVDLRRNRAIADAKRVARRP
ncbi:hypothetical protein [Catellatospora sp. NPDC049111]|jgi:hypothetical protein|uniref:hypothetical protein n=1 Tax=unclassified Catellatospora TaxID=2645785 RepID=UPI0033CB0501